MPSVKSPARQKPPPRKVDKTANETRQNDKEKGKNEASVDLLDAWRKLRDSNEPSFKDMPLK
eukprot:11403717-Ditylum_brightwellii.AAC.1